MLSNFKTIHNIPGKNVKSLRSVAYSECRNSNPLR